MFVDSVKTSNPNLRPFSPSGSQTILVFVYQTLWRYYNGDSVNGGASNAGGGVKKLLFSANISLYLHNDAR